MIAFVAVRLHTTLDESEPARRGNSSHVLAPPEAMAQRFADHPEAVHESGRLAERLHFDLTSDLGETRDLSKEKPEELARVRARYAAWEAEMEAAEPRGPFRDY